MYSALPIRRVSPNRPRSRRSNSRDPVTSSTSPGAARSRAGSDSRLASSAEATRPRSRSARTRSFGSTATSSRARTASRSSTMAARSSSLPRRLGPMAMTASARSATTTSLAAWCCFRRSMQTSASNWSTLSRSEEHTSELQSHSDLHSFPTRRSSDLGYDGLRSVSYNNIPGGVVLFSTFNANFSQQLVDIVGGDYLGMADRNGNPVAVTNVQMAAGVLQVAAAGNIYDFSTPFVGDTSIATNPFTGTAAVLFEAPPTVMVSINPSDVNLAAPTATVTFTF